MDKNMNTSEFVERFNETKKKDEQNRKRQGHGNPAKKLASKDQLKQ
ncbi:DUF4023 domain-containing protein [Aquibacillus rhizosphaerae]|uniref:DUF4023 domain-containing protein n=1 Tax=Aquibacillus rhizosphaerae TaxID=3051431 RepID=A0ABT7L8V0_9BACI|nr:DUF4023 domain-containing protein [Aquibacillus sp. LR5S19]MDL4840996.1 DUF4023 domain-containing protein [Aquibacillus sp. LR5S19]